MAKLCDNIDQMLARYLNTDCVVSNMRLPIVRLQKGVYLIGLMKWNMRLNCYYRLEVKRDSSTRWYSL